MRIPTLSKIKRFFEDLPKYYPVSLGYLNRKMLAYNLDHQRDMLRWKEKTINDHEILEKKLNKEIKKINNQNKENDREFGDIERELATLRSMCQMNNKLESDFRQRVDTFDRMVKRLQDLSYALNESQGKIESVNQEADRCRALVDDFRRNIKRDELKYGSGLENIAAQCGEKYDLYIKELEKKVAEFSISPAIIDRLDNIERRIATLSTPTSTEKTHNGSGKRKELPQQA